MNISSLITKSYEQRTMDNELNNKSNTNPGKLNFKGRRMVIAAIKRRFGGRFLLTKRAFFYSIESLETNTYNGLLFKLFKEKTVVYAG